MNRIEQIEADDRSGVLLLKDKESRAVLTGLTMSSFWSPDDDSVVVSAVVEGEPVAAKRPRLGGRRVYVPQEVQAYKELLAWNILVKAGHLSDEHSAFGVQAMFFRGNRQRVDIDNLLKTVLDACTLATLWKDDAQVREVAARLFLADERPRVEFVVYRLQNMSLMPCCIQCGKEIRRWYKSVPRQYCSAKCRHASARVELVCENCGLPFELPKSIAEGPGGKRKFCSRKCSMEARRKHATLAKVPKTWRCAVCGGPVSRKEYKRCRACFMKACADPKSNYWESRRRKRDGSFASQRQENTKTQQRGGTSG